MFDATGSAQEICREARALWLQLMEIEDRAVEVEEGASDRATPLRLRGLELIDVLERRIEREERELIPALRASGLCGGAGQAERLAWEHRERRLMLRLQLELVADPERSDVEVARRLRDFARLVRDDLERAIHVAPDSFPLRGDVFADVETAHLLNGSSAHETHSSEDLGFHG